MKSPSAPAGVSLLLGRDHEQYGAYHAVSISPQTVATISPGSDVDFLRSSTAKYDVNEDALLVFEDARHTVMCVADAHFGRASSEQLMEAIAAQLQPVPQNAGQLDELLSELAATAATQRYDSETTLLIAIHDRLFRQTFGVSFGDSSLVHLPAEGDAVLVNEKTTGFVSPVSPRSFGPQGARQFALSPRAGDLLIAYTDGIDECCYRDPDHSITLDVLAATAREHGSEPEAVARALTELALAGVDGRPGGQDNLVLAVTRV